MIEIWTYLRWIYPQKEKFLCRALISAEHQNVDDKVTTREECDF